MAMDYGISELYAYAGANSAQGNSFTEGLSFLGYPILAELAQRSENRRLVGTLAQEMTRRWCRLTTAGDEDKSEKIKLLDAAMKRYRVQDVFREAAEHDGYFGIGHILIDTGASDNPEELRTPLTLRPEKIAKGGLKGIRTIEPVWCYPTKFNSIDPLRPDFYKPTAWFVMGREIHSTRLLSLVSREVPDILKPAFMFGGISLTAMAKTTVENWLKTRQSVSDLLHSFTVWQLKTNMQATLMGGSGDEMLTRAQLFNQFRDSRGLMLVDKESEEIGNISAPLGTLDKLLAQSQEQQAAVDGMPLIKLVGYTPSGLNSTGEGEMDAWRDRVRAQQEHLFNEPLKRVMDVIQLSEFGEIDPGISFDWNPLEDPNEVERATTFKTYADAAVELITAGVLHPEDERKRLANDENSPYQGIDVNDLPDPPDLDDEGDMPGGEEDGGGTEGAEAVSADPITASKVT